MDFSPLDNRLEAYRQWREALLQTVRDYRAWMEKQHLLTAENQRRIDHWCALLDNDQLTVAFIAEFSRGKSELINAIFFADYGRRLLPSSAGRTTMCPTELLYDQAADEAYIRLLPIETRLQATSLRELRRQQENWVTYPLELNAPEQIEARLREVVAVRRVGPNEAARLGLYHPEQHAGTASAPVEVEIPKWRHAVISFPHPLLRKGLRILDTPGLNALGSEPELTLNMLPSAQAVLFVLAADTGVTRTDLELWQRHVKNRRSRSEQGLMVALNKTDAMWDELKQPVEIAAAINNQCDQSAEILGLSSDVVFPVSAQKGLLARIRGDRKLYSKSNLGRLEQHLSEQLVGKRKEIVQETISAEISHMLEATIGIVTSKRQGIRQQFNELHGLTGSSQKVFRQLTTQARHEQDTYTKDVNGFNASRRILRLQAKRLQQHMDPDQLEQIIDNAERKMSANWTTSGLRQSMGLLFSEMRDSMQFLIGESEQARKLVRGIYRRFQVEHGFSPIQPRLFSVMRYRMELEMLNQEVDIFRTSSLMLVTEKHFVIKRFFTILVGRARMIFATTKNDVDKWLNTVLDPLEAQIQERRGQMSERVQALRKIDASQCTLSARLEELKRQNQRVGRQLESLREMHHRLNQHHSAADVQPSNPKLANG